MFPLPSRRVPSTATYALTFLTSLVCVSRYALYYILFCGNVSFIQPKYLSCSSYEASSSNGVKPNASSTPNASTTATTNGSSSTGTKVVPETFSQPKQTKSDQELFQDIYEFDHAMAAKKVSLNENAMIS